MKKRFKNFIKNLKEWWNPNIPTYTHEQMMEDAFKDKEFQEAIRELFNETKKEDT